MLRFLLTPLALSVTSDSLLPHSPGLSLWKSYLHALVSMEGDVVVYFLCMNITWIPKLTAVHYRELPASVPAGRSEGCGAGPRPSGTGWKGKERKQTSRWAVLIYYLPGNFPLPSVRSRAGRAGPAPPRVPAGDPGRAAPPGTERPFQLSCPLLPLPPGRAGPVLLREGPRAAGPGGERSPRGSLAGIPAVNPGRPRLAPRGWHRDRPRCALAAAANAE